MNTLKCRCWVGLSDWRQGPGQGVGSRVGGQVGLVVQRDGADRESAGEETPWGSVRERRQGPSPENQLREARCLFIVVSSLYSRNLVPIGDHDPHQGGRAIVSTADKIRLDVEQAIPQRGSTNRLPAQQLGEPVRSSPELGNDLRVLLDQGR